MIKKPDITKETAGCRNINVAFPAKPRVFVDIVVRQFTKSVRGSRFGSAQLDRPPL